MAKVFGHDRDTAMRLREKSRKVIGSPTTGGAVLLPKRSDGGGEMLRFYRLAEDAKAGAFYAYRTNRTDTSPAAIPELVYNWNGILDNAQAGYHAIFGLIDGEWVALQGDCIEECVADATITVGDPPSGTVDVEYAGHTVTNSGLDANTLAATGLPAGLTMNTSGVVSGTPTESGTFYVVVTGDDGACTLTRIMVIEIAEAE